MVVSFLFLPFFPFILVQQLFIVATWSRQLLPFEGAISTETAERIPVIGPVYIVLKLLLSGVIWLWTLIVRMVLFVIHPTDSRVGVVIAPWTSWKKNPFEKYFSDNVKADTRRLLGKHMVTSLSFFPSYKSYKLIINIVRIVLLVLFVVGFINLFIGYSYCRNGNKVTTLINFGVDEIYPNCVYDLSPIERLPGITIFWLCFLYSFPMNALDLILFIQWVYSEEAQEVSFKYHDYIANLSFNMKTGTIFHHFKNLLYKCGFKVIDADIYVPKSKEFWLLHRKPRPAVPVRGPHFVFMNRTDHHLDMYRILQHAPFYDCHGVFLLTTTIDKLVGQVYDMPYWYDGGWYVKHPEYGKSEFNFWDYSKKYLVIRYFHYTHTYMVTRTECKGNRSFVLIEYLHSSIDPRIVEDPLTVHQVIYERGNGTLLAYRMDNYSDDNSTTHSFSDAYFTQQCFTLDHKSFSEVLARSLRARDANKIVSVGEIERVLLQHKHQDSSYVSSLLALWLSKNWIPVGRFNPILKIKQAEVLNDVSYEPTGPIVSSGKAALKSTGIGAMLNVGKGPTDSLNSDLNFVDKRVIKTLNTKTPPQEYNAYQTEFLVFMGLSANGGVQLAPMDIYEVREHQNKPVQKSQQRREEIWGRHNAHINEWNSFMKHESYCCKINDARAISSAPPSLREGYSRFTYPLADYIKRRKFSWYAFGLNPIEVTERIYELASKSEFLTPTDYSRWDGRHSEWLARFELSVLLSSYPKQYHTDIIHWWKSHYTMRMRTKHGIVYENGFGRPSGSPDTSLFNTIDNAFLAYIAYRESGLSSGLAWSALGIYGGDDGLSADVDPDVYTNVAHQCGLSLKVDKIHSTGNVPFLGRIFVSPRTCKASIIDVKRCISKIHVTPDMSTENRVVFERKLSALKVTDPYTPLISCMLEYYKTKFPEAIEAISEDAYMARQCYLEGATYPQECSMDILRDAVADNLGLPTTEIILAEEKILKGGLGHLFNDVEEEIAIEAVTAERVHKVTTDFMLGRQICEELKEQIQFGNVERNTLSDSL